jgi:transcription elongation factor Elf1
MTKAEKEAKTVKMTIEREGVKVNVSLDPEVEVKEVIKEVVKIKEVEVPVVTTEIKEIEVVKEVIKEIKVPTKRCPGCGSDNTVPVQHPEGYTPWSVYTPAGEKPTEHHDVHCSNCGQMFQVHRSIIEELKLNLPEGGNQ